LRAAFSAGSSRARLLEDFLPTELETALQKDAEAAGGGRKATASKHTERAPPPRLHCADDKPRLAVNAAVAMETHVHMRAQQPRMSAKEETPEDSDEVQIDAIESASTQPRLRPLKLIGDAIFFAWSALLQGMGLAFSLGLVLNLCGYGYRFNLNPPSLEIDTLVEMRRENVERRFLEGFGEGKLFPE